MSLLFRRMLRVWIMELQMALDLLLLPFPFLAQLARPCPRSTMPLIPCLDVVCFVLAAPCIRATVPELVWRFDLAPVSLCCFLLLNQLRMMLIGA